MTDGSSLSRAANVSPDVYSRGNLAPSTCQRIPRDSLRRLYEASVDSDTGNAVYKLTDNNIVKFEVADIIQVGRQLRRRRRYTHFLLSEASECERRDEGFKVWLDTNCRARSVVALRDECVISL